MTAKRKRAERRLLILAAVLALAALAVLWNMRTVERELYPCSYHGYVERYADRYGVDRWLVYAVIRTESGFEPTAESAAGARGMMQITEDTFNWLRNREAPNEGYTFDSMFDPEVNIRLGTYYLSLCLARYGDVSTAVAAYHSGWGTVDGLLKDSAYSSDGTCLHTFPYTQMNHYVHKVTKAQSAYNRLYGE